MGEARGWAGSPEMVEEALGWHSVSKIVPTQDSPS